MADLAYLGTLTNLKLLTIEKEHTHDEEVSHECLATVGKLTQIEQLYLRGFEFRNHDLAYLGGLKNLKSLRLPNVGFVDEVAGKRESDSGPTALAHLPVLSRLETFDLGGRKVGDRDLCRLAVFPRLKSLNLIGTLVSDAGLCELAPLESLQELAINLRMARPPGLEPLIALKGLREVHIPDLDFALAWSGRDDGPKSVVLPGGVDALRHGLQCLRQSHPGIVIAGNYRALQEKHDIEPSWYLHWDDDDTVDRGFDHYSVQQCIEER